MTKSSLKIKFKKESTAFFSDLKLKIDALLDAKLVKRAERLVRLKFIVYFSFFILFYALIFFIKENRIALCIDYAAIGLMGILLAFNGAHDAVHDTFSKNKTLNRLVFFVIFTVQGVNASLWRKRHIASHHIFPNVDGCDADIDNNPFFRLSKTHQLKRHHRYQHFYAPVLYGLYTLQWIFIKDFVYLQKKQLGNLKNFNFTTRFKLEVIALKLLYLIYIIAIPTCFTNFSLLQILSAFLVLHFVTSVFLVTTLVVSHLSMETAFPVADQNGVLPYDYYEHQLAVSLDFHATSTFANWIFGGFNSHAAHHLFPKMPPTLYTRITPLIRETALRHNLPYNEMSLYEAIISHLKYLKSLGQG